ncbi:MAG TPA: glutaredoxin family protein [Mycobacteriales bacterium]|nr:glutaredoxin family protein [Mycobacteriales bacterium]
MTAATAEIAERVVVVVNPGCHLCEDAMRVVAEVCGELGVGWRPVELATVEEPLRSQWRELIPVILVDGEVHDVFRAVPRRLREALSST